MTKDEIRDVMLEEYKVRDVTWPNGDYIYFCRKSLTVRNNKGAYRDFASFPSNSIWEIYEEPLQFTKRVWMREMGYPNCTNPSWLQDVLFEVSMSSPYVSKEHPDHKLYEITVKKIREEK